MKVTKLEEKPEIVRLNKLKDKLLDLSSRSRKIRFSISKWLSWDLTELVNKNNQNLISNFFFSASNLIIIHKENKENFSLDLEALLKKLSSEDILRFQKKITCLQKKNLSVYQEKGYKSLFLGVVFLRGYFYNNQNVLRLVNAPLFLLPCDLEKIKNLKLVFNSERKLNHSLLYYLQKELNLAKDKFTNFLNILEKDNEEINILENYLLFLNNELQQLISTSHIKIKFSPNLSSFLEEKKLSKIKENEPIPNPFTETSSTIIKNNIDKNFCAESFVKLTLINKPKNYPENQLEIVLNFCLTIDSEPNLSLFRDFEEIIDEYSQDKVINWSKSALNLLRGEMDNIIAYPEKKETNHQSNPLYAPFPSDPSQNHILRVIFQNFSENALCIDGPPGTGKSQLICNLLTNSLFYQKKVLVICEKEVALKVIYDKLSSLGLNHSIVKINELAQTPQIYREILNNIENNQQENINQEISDITSQIVSLEEKLAANFKQIEKYCETEKEFQINYQISLQEVYIKFERKTQLTPTIVKLNNWVRNKEQLDKLKAQIKNYISKFTKIFSKWKQICLKLKNLFLENDSQEFKFNLENQNNSQEIISDILKELKGEKTKVNIISKILRINLLQKYSEFHHSPEIIKTKLKDLEDLRTNKQYQIFFSFLEIESFSDFWQKCSDEKFLIDIQEFISEEFLTIGELSTVSDGEAKKNIDHFLERVLVGHEFSYLDNYEEITEQAVYFNWIKEVEEENKENLANWNYEDLANIQQEQREIAEKKISLVKNILKIKQKQNLEKLLTNLKLKKELSKKRKISSLKKLFPELVNYFPIWLSTPEVIASITNLQEPIFDFLVFDEASQIPLEKTIPLWARAKKCIIIGDEQQLPPTDFFKSHLENDEEIWEKEEEEQLLSETKEKINLETDDLEKNSSLLSYAKKHAHNREKLTLLYHYRSKYPELIEFSNQAFYNGTLQIISASEIKKKDYLPIEYHYQDKGRWINNENQIEALYIIELLKTLPENKEVGIITFNSTQRDFLVDLIGEGNKNNNLFIKSLEEVQGDERDIIIFSIGYAPNKEGKIFLNFGPLNKEGGEKRLNVAISRAREKLIIVTSLLPSDLKRITEEDKNRKLGPKLFKKYLEYAYYCSQKQQEKVRNILEHSLPKITNSSLYKKSMELEEFGSMFEEKVYNELVSQKYPYEIHKQVKSIGYRIDLAIWDNQIQQYILGIECDGEYWHGKLENIEKDIYRQQILEDKGWKIMRILSRDWSRNKRREIERIKKELE